MLAHSDLHRSITNMTISLARRMDKRARVSDDFKLTEREEQFQYEISGAAGTLPAEGKIKIPFDVIFLGDPGVQRDSTLDRPQVRIGFEIEVAPPGLIPYAHVSQWTYDDDYNFTGCEVTVGVHCPAVLQQGLPLSATRYKATLHISFQGYGWVSDVDAGRTPNGGDPSYVTNDLLGVG